MTPRSWPVLACTLLAAAASCNGALGVAAEDPSPQQPATQPPAPRPGMAQAQQPAICPTEGTAISGPQAPLPVLQELTRFRVNGDPWFASDAEDVYWVSYAAPGSPMQGGPTTIEGHRLRRNEPVPERLFHLQRNGNRSLFGGGLRAAGLALTWLEFFPSKPPTSGSLYSTLKAGGPPSVLLEGLSTTSFMPGGLRLLGTDDDSVYLSPISPIGITTVVRATGAVAGHVPTPVAPTLGALDGDRLYWVGGDALWRSRRVGSDPQQLASGLPAADALAVHDGIAWLALGRFAPKRLARVAVSGSAATCTLLAPWRQGGRDAQLVADASGVFVALEETSGQTADTAWWIRADGTIARQLLGAEEGRRIRLLGASVDGLLLATSRPDGEWAIARLPATAWLNP